MRWTSGENVQQAPLLCTFCCKQWWLLICLSVPFTIRLYNTRLLSINCFLFHLYLFKDWVSTMYFYISTCTHVSINLHVAIDHFQVTFSLSFKARPGAQPFIWKWVLICMWMNSHFHMKGWAPRLDLRKRIKAIRKWPIVPDNTTAYTTCHTKLKLWQCQVKSTGTVDHFIICYTPKTVLQINLFTCIHPLGTCTCISMSLISAVDHIHTCIWTDQYFTQ